MSRKIQKLFVVCLSVLLTTCMTTKAISHTDALEVNQKPEMPNNAFHIDYQPCPGFENNPYYELVDFWFDSPPVAGAENYVTVKANCKQTLFLDHFWFKLNYGIIKMYEGNFPWSQWYYGGETYEQREYAPTKFGLPGTYNGEMRMFDQAGVVKECITFKFNLRRAPNGAPRIE